MTSQKKTVVLLASDLMLTSTVSGYANAAGLEFLAKGTAAEVVALNISSATHLLLLDLGTPELDLAHLTNNIPPDSLRATVAYGPHVHTAKLAAAQAAGVGQVISRGQFSAQVGQLVMSFANSGE